MGTLVSAERLAARRAKEADRAARIRSYVEWKRMNQRGMEREAARKKVEAEARRVATRRLRRILRVAWGARSLPPKGWRLTRAGAQRLPRLVRTH